VSGDDLQRQSVLAISRLDRRAREAHLVTAAELSRYIGAQLTIMDLRTGVTYSSTVEDAKASYGTVLVRAAGCSRWFAPAAREIELERNEN